MSLTKRALRHARLSWQARPTTPRRTPPFLILFINSICNLKCEHCFYWKHLNQRDDLSLEELRKLSQELDGLENLNLSGGEPFMRVDLPEVCHEFVERNGVKQIYCPTNGYYTEKTVAALSKLLEHDGLQLFAVELSLDGCEEFHNRFRGNPRSFQKAMETYDALVELQRRDPRLRIHSIATVTDTNVEEIRRLTTFLHRRCPQMDHHNIALIRGDRKNPSLQGPALRAYQELYGYVRRLWADREKGRFGASVDPMLTWAKVQTAQERRMVVPCKAGWLTGVVNANGDVALCETEHTHPPVGNLREHSFREIWWSPAAEAQRQAIRARRCHCTNEVFLWPSLTFQPRWLARAALGARLWERPAPLPGPDRSKPAAAAGAKP